MADGGALSAGNQIVLKDTEIFSPILHRLGRLTQPEHEFRNRCSNKITRNLDLRTLGKKQIRSIKMMFFEDAIWF